MEYADNNMINIGKPIQQEQQKRHLISYEKRAYATFDFISGNPQ